MKRWQAGLGIVAAVVAIAGATTFAFSDRIALWGMHRLYTHIMADDPYAGLGDGLHIGLCGSGSPMADPTREGPCEVVLAGKRLFVIDSGNGSTRTLYLMNLPPAKVEAVFLTHFHSDHIGGLGELMLQRWAGGAATTPLPIYGPTGVDKVVNGFMAAYELDRGYRIAHHGPIVVPPSGFGGTPRPFAVEKTAPDVVLIDEGGLKVTAFPVDHEPVEPAVGYRFDYKGRSLVISGDTAPSARLEAEARGADLLAHEGLSPALVQIQHDAAVKAGRTNLAAITHDILSYHTTPEQASAIAERAGVRYLLFEHVIPPLPFKALEGPWLGKSRKIFHGTIRVGHDGDFISLPVGSRKIQSTNRFGSLF